VVVHHGPAHTRRPTAGNAPPASRRAQVPRMAADNLGVASGRAAPRVGPPDGARVPPDAV